MNKRKSPMEWTANCGQLSPKQPKSHHSLLDDSDMDQLLTDIDFDDIMEVDAVEHDTANGTENVAQTVTVRDDYLDLSSWKRCLIETVERDTKTYDLILTGCEDVRPRAANVSNKPMYCRLRDAWSNSRINESDIVSLKAVWNADKNWFNVTNSCGFIVTKPDLLISGTTVVSGLFCIRKAILTDRFSGINSNNKIMTIGSIVHELLQIVLQRKLTTLAQIRDVVEEMLMSQQMAFTLYASQMTAAEAYDEVKKFEDKILEFVEKYLIGNNVLNGNKDGLFEGKIDNIQDIEENIWIPHMGLKGKVDASVNVRIGNNKAHIKYMPLELKTGRASFSSEHKGQLIIYQMMMSEVGAPVNSGLLLYLREGVMKEIPGTHNERRDLLLLRNEMAYYLSQSNVQENSNGHVSLPGPISFRNACTGCPYGVVCSLYLKQDVGMWSSLNDDHPMKELAPLLTSHLTEAHVGYFCHWVGLLTLEEREAQKSNQIRSLWLDTPEQRQKNGRAIINLQLNENVIKESDNCFLNKFSQIAGSAGGGETVDLTCVGVNLGDYLIVSTTKRLNVAAGRVHSLKSDEIVIVLERNLHQRYLNNTFILDKYESKTIANFNMANLGALLDDTEGSERLRRIIVDKIEPTYSKTLPRIIGTEGKELLRKLNAVQQKAVIKSLTANDYLLLKGLPGTGKTQTLTTIIRLFVLMGKSVLITSHTHSAVDNVLLRLLAEQPDIKFLRLGAKGRVKSALWNYCESEVTKDCHTPEDLQQIYSQYNVVGVTCLGAAHALLAQKQFDVCLVDESTQVFQTTVIRPLLFAKKFILVGDPDQLPPIVRSLEARKLGADQSLFVRLDSPEATVALTMQYRMNSNITKLANALTYNGSLTCGTEQIAKATLKFQKIDNDRWIQRVLSSHIDQSTCFIDTGNVHQRCVEYMASLKTNDPLAGMARHVKCEDDQDAASMPNPSVEEKYKTARMYTNYCEAAVLLQLIRALKQSGIDGCDIGVIAPYVLQVELLTQIICKNEGENDVEVNTVDQYQGRDKKIIIYSCTKTGQQASSIQSSSSSSSISASATTTMDSNGKKINSTKIEILDDQRRLTVAITRAKHKLILIGDTKALECYAPFRCLLQSMSSMNKINLIDGQHGFDWAKLLQHLNGLLRQNEGSD